MFVWFCLLLIVSFKLAISTEPDTRDVLACGGGPLALTCSNDEVVAAEIYTVTLKCSSLNSADYCACATESRDCLTTPLTIVSDVNSCRWKRSECRLNLSFFTPCLVAKEFHCVKREEIYDICEGSRRELTNGFGYITTPGYPSSFHGGLRCSVRIRIPWGMSVYIRMVTSHLPPTCEGDKMLDYLQISSDRGDGYTFCGDVDYSSNTTWILSGDVATLTFVSRDDPRTYHGFVLLYRYIKEDAGSSVQPSAVVTLVTSSSSSYLYTSWTFIWTLLSVAVGLDMTVL